MSHQANPFFSCRGLWYFTSYSTMGPPSRELYDNNVTIRSIPKSEFDHKMVIIKHKNEKILVSRLLEIKKRKGQGRFNLGSEVLKGMVGQGKSLI